MNKKLIKRIVLAVMACASVGALVFAGCSKPAEHTHTADSQWHTDENNHWHECTAGDGAKLDDGAHLYDNGQDTTCNTCGYTRTVDQPEIVKVEGVAFADTTGTLNTETEEKTIQLTPVFTPENATNKNVTWASDNPTVASVDNSGLVTAHRKSGTAVITVTTEDGGKIAIYTLTVEGPAVTATTPVLSKYSQDELETAYVEWTVAQTEGVWFNVYYKADNGSTWTKLDDELVRQYPDYYRADMVGLKAGTYSMKIVPTVDGNEVGSLETIANNITVKAHDRSGYGFADGKVPGAYNLDGTLKANAKVIYVTALTAKTVTCTVIDGKNTIESKGFQTILDDRQGSGDTTPLCFRIIGTVNLADLDHISSSAEGLQIKTTSNVTIEGIGNDATIKGWGMLIRNCTEIELRNFGVMNFIDDGISIDTDNKYLWVHNLDIFYGGKGSAADQAKGDGSIDTKVSSHITNAYNHFWDSGKCNLQGMKSESTENCLTYHHNWYDHSDSRHPRVRTCTVHVYNNYYDGIAKYGIGATTGASIFAENNYFRSTATLRPMLSSGQGTDAQGDGTFSGENGGIIKSFGNVYDVSGGGTLALKTYQQGGFASADDSDCYAVSSRDEKVPSTVTTVKGGTTYNNFDTASDFYSYTVDTAEQAKLNVERYAGRIDGGDFKWEFDDKVDDPDYAVNTELKNAITNYTQKVIKIGNVATGSNGSSSGGETGGETGGEGGGSSATPIEGEIVFIPKSDTNSSFTVTGSSKSHAAITVGGLTIPKNGALKLDSSGTVTFTTSEEMTMTLYLLNSKTVSVDGTAKTVTAEGSYYVYTVTLAAGSHTISKGGGENALYAIKLSPVA